MDVAFNKNDWAIAPAPALAGAQADCIHPEWHGLLARFKAARQVWEVLGSEHRARDASPMGSFDKSSASRLAGLERAIASVNQKNSGNRNCDGDIVGPAADNSSIGARGQR
ncbi:MAG: hypothetical protein KUG65_00350 [Sphingomonadaceae bacterium]|nr:hypothetical protein [Sphingomonadaceae bacterium]